MQTSQFGCKLQRKIMHENIDSQQYSFQLLNVIQFMCYRIVQKAQWRKIFPASEKLKREMIKKTNLICFLLQENT